jgi:ATP-dependent RNA helicase DDX24/MAK5
MPPLKPLRNKRRIGGNGIEWDTLAWKSVQSEDGQEVLDGFCGLEELDGNILADLIANKSNSSTTKLKGEKGSILNNELNSQKEKKNKKQKKNNPDDIEVDDFNEDEIMIEEEEETEEVKKIKLQELKKKEMKKAQKMERRKLLKEKKAVKKEELKSTIIDKVIEEVSVEEGDVLWGDIKLHVILQKSLVSLGFITPTPIQTAAIPKIITGRTDIVGAAETGSGKTLAFALPVIDSLLRNWEITRNQTCPYALIIAPTRELALQISKVVKDVCAPFRNLRRIEVVSVVGGMAEQKQRRQLSGLAGNTVDILIATPGRLCELIQDESIVAFTDMSRMKFLIVDEADRIVEEGHFPELHRVFSRVRDHEKIAEKGECPKEVALKAKQGVYEMGDEEDNKKAMEQTLRQRAEGINKITMKDDKYRKNNKNALFNEKEQVVELGENNISNGDDDDDIEDFDDMEEIVFDTMPTEAELEEARRTTEAIPYDELEFDSDNENGNETDKYKEIENKIIENEKLSNLLITQNVYIPRQRQTLLFSATAIRNQKDIFIGKKQKLKGLNGSEEVKSLPYHMQQ